MSEIDFVSVTAYRIYDFVTLGISSAVATSTLKRSEYSPPSSIDDGSTTRPWVINRVATQHDADTAVTPR